MKEKTVRITICIMVLLVMGCETKIKFPDARNVEIRKPTIEEYQLEKKEFLLGDVNNDKVEDTAFVSLKRNIATDEIEFGEKSCCIYVKFSSNMPEIIFDSSLGVFIKKAADLNGDNSNEIVVFSRTHEGWWNSICVFSFQKGNWHEIASTKGFITTDNDLENRIVKQDGAYYLMGEDQWKEDENGEFLKTKVKI